MANSSFYSGQTDYIEALNVLADEFSASTVPAVLSGNTYIDCSLGATILVSFASNGSTTLLFSNVPTKVGASAPFNSYSINVLIKQPASGTGLITAWPTAVRWPAGTTPTLTATASRYDLFRFTTIDGGTRWFGQTIGLNYNLT